MPQKTVFQRAHTPLLAALCLVLVASLDCGGDPSSPGEPVEPNVSVESSHRTQAAIGPAGGTLTTTDNAGVTYTLDIPAGALPAEVGIAMTPISSIKGLPYSEGIEGAVQLAPSGLVLIKPALLTIGATATPGVDQKLVGFSFEGDAAAFELVGAVQGSDHIQVLVSHFSGAGAALASPTEFPSCSDPNPGLVLGITCIPPTDPDASARFIAVLRDYLNNVVVPAIDAASGDDLRSAILEYIRWEGFLSGFMDEYHTPDAYEQLGDDIDAAKTLMATKVAQAIAVAKERCTFTGSIEPVRQIFEFENLALLESLDAFGPGLDRESIEQGICATVVIESVSLADPLPLNADRSLDVRFALEINGVRQSDGLFEAKVSAVGATVQHPTGRTNAKREYTTVVRRESEDSAVFTVRGCLMLSLFEFGSTSRSHLMAVPICAQTEVSRGVVSNGALVLLSHNNSAHAETPEKGAQCTGDPFDDDQDAAPGSTSVSATATSTCNFVDIGTSHATASASQDSDPGLAADGKSALMTFHGSATASVQTSSSQLGMDCRSLTNTSIEFKIKDDQMGFEIDASFDGTIGNVVIHIQGGPAENHFWEKAADDGKPSTFHTSGNLPAGTYLAEFGVDTGTVISRGAIAGGTCRGTATVAITQAPVAAAAIAPALPVIPREAASARVTRK